MTTKSDAAQANTAATCECCGLQHGGLRCDCTGCAKCEDFLTRMSREKLDSVIAWFKGGEQPNLRRVTRGDMLTLLTELQERRQLPDTLTRETADLRREVEGMRETLEDVVNVLARDDIEEDDIRTLRDTCTAALGATRKGEQT